jgi:hypothetical protein
VTITVDWQAELRGVTVGASTSYPFTGPIGGLGVSTPRTADHERGLSAGDVGGTDVAARRVLTLQLGVDGTSASNGWGLFETLKVAWQSSPVDVALDLRLPGFSSVARRFYGRPRGVDDNLDLLRLGWIDALATFEALDPYGYGPEVPVALSAGETVLVNAGAAPTDRYVLVATVTTAPVVFSNAADDEPGLTLTGVTGVVTIDGRARTVTSSGGVDLYGSLVAGSGWPVLAPGSNTLTLTGATGALTYRPAYL